MIEFVLFGNIPSKKNSKRIIRRHGKPIIISSKNYLEWEKEVIKNINWCKEPINEPCKIDVTIHPENNRLFDISNKLEACQDMLVKAGVIEDDNYKIISEINLRIGEKRTQFTTYIIITKKGQ